MKSRYKRAWHLAWVLALPLLLVHCDGAGVQGPELEAGSEPDAAVTTAAKAVMVDVCHKRDSQGYILIAVAEAAYQTHVDHGDGGIGDAVPDMAGYVFDETCTPVPGAPSCPCFDAATLDLVAWNAFNVGTSLEAGTSTIAEVLCPSPLLGCVASCRAEAIPGRDDQVFPTITKAEAGTCLLLIEERAAELGL